MKPNDWQVWSKIGWFKIYNKKHLKSCFCFDQTINKLTLPAVGSFTPKSSPTWDNDIEINQSWKVNEFEVFWGHLSNFQQTREHTLDPQQAFYERKHFIFIFWDTWGMFEGYVGVFLEIKSKLFFTGEMQDWKRKYPRLNCGKFISPFLLMHVSFKKRRTQISYLSFLKWKPS